MIAFRFVYSKLLLVHVLQAVVTLVHCKCSKPFLLVHVCIYASSHTIQEMLIGLCACMMYSHGLDEL